MTVTALIPTKNRSKLLRRAISSVQNQNYKDVKIYVRDNCSTDDTQDVVKELQSTDARIQFLSLPKDIGVHENFREGLKSIDTEYFSILSDDDYLHENFYDTGINLLEKNPSAEFVVFEVDFVDINGNVILNNSAYVDKDFKLYNSEEGISQYLKIKIPYTWTGYIFRKKVAESIDLGDFSEVGYGMDIRFIWHAASRFDFIVTGTKGAYFTMHPNSISANLVKDFDERYKYWWRRRILMIVEDSEVSLSVKEILLEYYFKSTKKKYSNKINNLSSAFNLISYRLKVQDYLGLRLDFVSMREFFPWYLIFVLKYIYTPLEVKGLIKPMRDKIRNLRRKF
jgi:glycosyltransferase involved in cell wall biosynthesis